MLCWLLQGISRRRAGGSGAARCGHSIVVILATRSCSSLHRWRLLWKTGEKVMSDNGYMSRKPCKVLGPECLRSAFCVMDVKGAGEKQFNGQNFTKK